MNPILTSYLEISGLSDRSSSQDNGAVKTYFDRQNWSGVGEAFGLVPGALVGGHPFEREPSAINTTFAWVFNSTIHIRAIVEVGFSLFNLLDSRLFSTGIKEINDFLKLYIAMKTGRFALRAPHAALPAIQNDSILGILFGASAARLATGATFGSFINRMAQIIHFRAYQEGGHLPRYDARRWEIIVDGKRSVTSTQGVDAENMPYTRLVRAIFSPDTARLFTPYPERFVDAIIGHPAGWTAIAHRLVVL